MDDYLIVHRAVILVMLLGLYVCKSVFCKYLSCDLVEILWAPFLITLFEVILRTWRNTLLHTSELK